MRLFALAWLWLSAVAGPAGCSDDEGLGALKTSGAIIGQGLPAAVKLVIAWSVTAGSPDYGYKFGGGTATGVSYQLECPGEPPAEALTGEFSA